MLKVWLIVLFGCFATQAALAVSFDHSEWDQLLRQHVVPLREGRATVVDYEGMSRDRTRLKSYLDRLASVSQPEFDQWPREERLAFLINAYNAWTVELVFTGYPGLESIKNLGSFFRSPWQKAFIPLLGETRSLDDIEHGLIRGSGHYNDPRIHFAVNCASIGCPALRPEAYTGDQLEAQLVEQTHLFLADRTRNRLEERALKVSSIFKWYRKDFENGWMGIHSLPAFFARYAESLGVSPADVKRLQAGVIGIEYLDYDWRLNGK